MALSFAENGQRRVIESIVSRFLNRDFCAENSDVISNRAPLANDRPYGLKASAAIERFLTWPDNVS